MKAFISSVLSGYTEYREAAGAAVRSLRHKVIWAEEFGARPDTPQQACLEGVRLSDVVVLLLGAAYGSVQDSGLSATHEEWKEAVADQKPVLVFVEKVDGRDQRQDAFIAEVESWSQGRLRRSFASPTSLQEEVVRALNDLATRTPNDDSIIEMKSRAKRILDLERFGFYGNYPLSAGIAAGPRRRLLRPSRVGEGQISSYLQQAAQFGSSVVLDPQAATSRTVADGNLCLKQEQHMIVLDEFGSILVVQSAITEARDMRMGFSAVIVEDLTRRIEHAFRFMCEALDQIDELLRSPYVVPAVAVGDVGHLPWRTRAEHALSPNSYSPCGIRGGTVFADPPYRHRLAFASEAGELAEDLVHLLQRNRDRFRFF